MELNDNSSQGPFYTGVYDALCGGGKFRNV